jgi:hypothetical protein
MKIKNIQQLVFAALAAYALNQSVSGAETNIIGVGVPTGTTRNDAYIGAGFEFYAPASGSTINALGYWDASGTGLLAPHTVSLFEYSGSGSSYNLLVTATIPPGTNAPLINNYRWVGIPTTALPNNGQGGGYYAILATEEQDTWANSIGSAPYLNPAIGTVSGLGILNAGPPYTVLSSSIPIGGTGNANQGYGGANLAFLTNQLPTQPSAAPILWTAEGAFTDDTVLSLAGPASEEVYGVDFGGSGLETTTNGYTFNDYLAAGNMTLSGVSTYEGFLGGGGTSGDSSFDAVLNAGAYGSGANDSYLQNLTVGQKYYVLVVCADTRNGSGGKTFELTDDLNFSPAQTFGFTGGTPSLGGYILGTFSATATNQLLQISSSDPQYHGILVTKVPSTAIILVTNTTPASASVEVGTNIAFTAAFSNTPPVNLQWQGIVNGVTNNLNAGVVIWTNNGVIASTLTLTDLRVTDSGSYRLKATAIGNSANISYSTPAALTVNSVIT